MANAYIATSKTLLSVKKSFVHALGEKIFFVGKMRTMRILGAFEPGMMNKRRPAKDIFEPSSA